MSRGAIGILETRGMASLLGASDAMLKAAEVRICGRHGIGSGWLTVVIKGQVAAAGVRQIADVDMPVFDKRRFQDGAAPTALRAQRLPAAEAPYRQAFARAFGR